MATLNTVLGPIDASQVGGTMSHVHLTIDILCWHQPPDSGVLRGLSESKITMQNLGLVRRNAMLFKDNLVQDDLDLATHEAAEYKFAGRWFHPIQRSGADRRLGSLAVNRRSHRIFDRIRS